MIFNGHEFLTMRGVLRGVAFNKALKGMESALLNLSCSTQLFSFLQRFMGGLMRLLQFSSRWKSRVIWGFFRTGCLSVGGLQEVFFDCPSAFIQRASDHGQLGWQTPRRAPEMFRRSLMPIWTFSGTRFYFFSRLNFSFTCFFCFFIYN